MFRIEHDDPMWQVRTPAPQDQIVHVGVSADRERRHQDAGRFFAYETVGHPPRCRLATMGEVIPPATCQVCARDPGVPLVSLCPKVDDTVNINVIGADRGRIKAMREAVRLFGDHAFRRTSEIERGHSDAVEATAADLCAIAGERGVSPCRYDGAIAQPLEPHAKLPLATASR